MHGRFTIEGFGRHVPERVLTNADLESMVETSDDWITTRTGIKTRHIAAPGEAASDLAAKACQNALADAGRPVEDVSQIFFATFTPDSICPPAACILEHKLGISGRPASDVSAACSGFLFALDHALGTLARKPDATVLVTASEVTSSRTNWEDRGTCVLFGDGAGAVVLSTREPKPGQAVIRDVILHSDGSMWPLLTVKGGGSGWPLKLGETVKEDFFIEMNGPEVYKNAVRSMGQVCEEIVEKNGLKMDDIDLFIPHQANLRIIEATAKRLDMSMDQVIVTVDKHGNTSSGSVPLALDTAIRSGRVERGQLLLLEAFGGGFTWGSVLLRY